MIEVRCASGKWKVSEKASITQMLVCEREVESARK